MVFDARALDLSGKVAVVTGAAAGIGRASALSLAACGAQVALCDRNADGLAETANECAGDPLTRVMDVRDAAAVETFCADIAERFGHVDVLVNNAGGGFYAAVLDISARGQQALIDENYSSVLHFIRGCVPLMKDGGSIVNLTSVEAFRSSPGFGIYGSMKAAVEQLSRTLALELALRRIRVNTIAPDGIPTPGDDALGTAVSQGQREAYVRKLPLGWGDADDCAGAVLFLASDLSRYVTGTTLHVDGGSLAASGWVQRDDGTYEP